MRERGDGGGRRGRVGERVRGRSGMEAERRERGGGGGGVGVRRRRRSGREEEE